MGDKDSKIDQDATVDLKQERYRDLFALLGKRVVWLFVKLVSWKMLLWVGTFWLAANSLIDWWGYVLISIFVFGVRSFEKAIDKGVFTR